MSVIQYPEAMNASDLQIWNNAAFDNGESEDPLITKASWCPIKPIIVNRSGSFESASTKENQSPVLIKSPISVKSPAQIKPLHPNGAIQNSTMKPIKPLPKQGLVEKPVSKSGSEELIRDEKKIDSEIEEIEKEISRLSSRLQVLKLEKAEQNVKLGERRGRVIPAKFMEQKQNVKNSEELKKSEENLLWSAKAKVQRRGVSMGPGEIIVGGRRGMSMGPSEIIAGAKPRQLGKLEITPVQPIQSRRKSCFWKLQDIDEEKVIKERGKSLSLSPKSRKALCKTQGPRQAATTVGLRKAVKKEDVVLSSIQPKKLFRDGEKSVAAKKSQKPGRVIASRYNQSTIQSALRKRSLPENDKDESKRCDKKRVSSETIRNQGTESRVKKKWEVPSEIVVCGNLETEKSQPSISVVPDMLPRIRTARYAIETPRDSGPAKRVAELIGKKSYFCNDGDVEPSVCQALSFAEEDFEEEQNGN